MRIYFVVWLVVCPMFGTCDGTEVRVQTPVGEVIGSNIDVFTLFTARRFYGIPYAEAPVGNLRFQKPVPKAPFSSALNATEKGVICFQTLFFGIPLSYEQSEDCLLLNVYSPSDASPSNKKAVMVWIHGGGFFSGSANDYNGELLAAFGDVVVVTLNYRLYIHGFLSTGDSTLPGNLGLWDQQLAIQWVRDNIEAFGGDPNTMTIFGESAGSASVAYQLFYPGNLGLFQRAIAQSGGITDIWAFVKQDSVLNVYSIAAQVGCERNTTAHIVDCLQTVSNEKLMSAKDLPVQLAPVFDNDFVRDLPERLLSENTRARDALEMFHSVDLLVGFTNADGLEIIGPSWMPLLGKEDFENFTVTRQEFEEVLVPYTLKNYYQTNLDFYEAAMSAVINEYTDFSDPDDDTNRIKKLTDLATDTLFGVTAIVTADLHSKSEDRSTYSYKFAVKPVVRVLPIPDTFDGPDVMMHGDDILFVFGVFIEYVAEPGNELFNVYQATMTMWSNFAKSGNPNTPGDVTQYLNIDWPEYGDSGNYIEIRTTPGPARQNYGSQAATFWSHVVPRALGICPYVDQTTSDITISSSVGDILGKEEYIPLTNECGYRVKKFLGIPYAEPPTGNLRFKKPVSKANFNELFNATVEGDTCYQPNLPMLNEIFPRSEDCLFLNVYVPAKAANETDKRKPVMILIHPGSFLYGQSNSYSDVGILSGYGDVIVVTINYRLSMLGFLTTGDSSLPGNLGLWDQQLAIRWVHDNIAAFGGDTNMITVFGSASVIYQCFYPGNKGLFQRAIAQSGTNDNVWSYQELSKAVKYTRAVAQNFSCTLQSTASFVDCLREKPIDEIETFISESSAFPLPVRDNDFVLDTPYNLIAGTTAALSALDMFYSVDLLMGVNNFEGIFDIILNGILLPITQEQFETEHVPHFLEMVLGKSAPRGIELATIHEYTDWLNLTSGPARAYKVAEMFTDAFFAVNTIRTADQHLNTQHNKSTYMYQFGVKPTTRRLPIPPILEGNDVASNGDEIPFVTGRGIQDVQVDDLGKHQFKTYSAVMNMWSNFAKTGDPNRPQLVTHMIETTWPVYSSSRDYLDIKPEMTSAKNSFRSKAHSFWTGFVAESMKMAEMQDACITSAGNSIRYYTSIVLILFVIVLNLY